MNGRWDASLLPAGALCVLMLAPLACRRAEAPMDVAKTPTTTSQEAPPAPDQSVAQRERAVAEREAKVAEREAELVRLQAASTPPPRVPKRPQVIPTAIPAPTAVPTQPPAPIPHSPVEVLVPAGTELSIEFNSPIASNTVTAGSRFRTRLTNDVSVSEVLAIPAGTEVHGTVVEAVPAKKIGGQARLALSFDYLKLATGETIPIAATFAEAAKSQKGKDTATIGGAAAGGAILGRVLDKKHKTKGTVLGALVGGAIGTAIAANTPGEEIQIRSGTVIEIRLTAPVRVVVAN